MRVDIPLRLGRGGNDRQDWRAKARHAVDEKNAVGWALLQRTRPAPPIVVTLTRVSPGRGLDSDNNVAACKYVRDAVAAWLGVDDADESQVRYRYAQARGEWGVRIETRPKT